MVTFSDEALDDLENIRSWIAADRPMIAVKKYIKLKAACQSLDRFPYKGRSGKRDKTRELSVYLWIITYKIIVDDEDPLVEGEERVVEPDKERIIQIVKIRHSSQDDPDA